MTTAMPASSFITALTLDSPAWPASTRPENPLVLAQCRFSVEDYRDEEFSRHAIPHPPRLQRAVAKRRSEFLAGRVCARQAMKQLGIDGLATNSVKRRDPIWPSPCTGAITHSHGVAAALVGLRQHWQGIGLDIEHWIKAEDARHLASAILQPHEIALLDDDDAAFARQLTLLFSAKETLFKALNPLTGTSFYFHDASLLQLDTINRTLMLRLECTLNDQWARGTVLTCYYAEQPTHVTTWLTISI